VALLFYDSAAAHNNQMSLTAKLLGVRSL